MTRAYRRTLFRLSPRSAGVALAAVALALPACGPRSEPVAALAASPRSLRLAWPESAEVELALTPRAELPSGVDRPIVFVHLLDEPGSVVRTFDHELPGAWRRGGELRYRLRLFQSALAPPLAAGSYLLSIGLYDPELGRFALATRAEEVAKLEYQIATVEVPPLGPAGPEARFSGEWLAPEAAADRQVVASRRLRGGQAGTIRFGPFAGPGTIHVGLVLPRASGDDGRVDLDPGATLPKVRVESSCGGVQSEISGTGRMDVDLAVPAGAAPSTCEIVVAPNFVVRPAGRGEPTSVRLEELSFAAGDGGEA
jgi:hypothetical protein